MKLQAKNFTGDEREMLNMSQMETLKSKPFVMQHKNQHYATNVYFLRKLHVR